MLFAVMTVIVFLLSVYGIYQVVTPKQTTEVPSGEAPNIISEEISNSTVLTKRELVNNYTFYSDEETKEENGATTELTRMNPGFLAVVGILAVLIGFLSFSIYFSLFTRKFSRYLREIIGGIKELSTGNFNAVISLREDDEFTDIARHLNRMAKDIKEIMEGERSIENEKNELITNVAHDLRTPLTSIIGYLDIVSNKELPPDMREKYIGIAYSKSKRLEKLIEDLFMYTKFEFGQVALRLEQVDLVKMMEQLLDEFYPSFCDQGLEYELKLTDKQIIVEADGSLLARAFANLIGNAIKYGKNGKNVNISLETTQTQVITSIVNYGEIIPKKDIDKIFEKFYRVDSSRNSELGGSGLGLAIAKNIIVMHNGTIQVRSSLEGTVFEVTLNLEGQDE
jgi:signal transduction histidine kinase